MGSEKHRFLQAEDWHVSEHRDIRGRMVPVCDKCLAEHGTDVVDGGVKIDIHSLHRIRTRAGSEYCYEQMPNGLEMAISQLGGKK